MNTNKADTLLVFLMGLVLGLVIREAVSNYRVRIERAKPTPTPVQQASSPWDFPHNSRLNRGPYRVDYEK